MIARKINKCRICNGEIIDILNLGSQPPANSLHNNKKKQKFIKLNLVICKSCSTAQLDTTVSKEYLFKNYFWVTGTSTKAIEYAKKFFLFAKKRIKKKKFSVLEIASNDCTFLKPFFDEGCNVLGVDPAKNINKKVKNIKTLTDFFNYKYALKLKKKYDYFDFIFARNIIPHNENVNSIIKGFSELMSKDSVGAIEFHYAGKILDENHYDSIYHEHIYYFTIKTLENILKKYSLNIFDCEISPISGGSIVIFFKKKKILKSKKLLKLIKNENKKKYNSLNTWKKFGQNCIDHSSQLNFEINKILKSNLKPVAYGASARSSTMLNFSKINSSHISHIIDKNKLKDGYFTAGSNIKIKSFNKEKKKISNYKWIIILAWNFKTEIVKDLKNNGFKGKMLIPLPSIKIINENKKN